MNVEFCCEINGTCVKKVSIFTEKQKTYVQVLELRENSLGKSGWLPVHFSTHDLYEDAKAKFIGHIVTTAYENSNNTQETYRENLFVRGSLPSSINKRIL